MGRIVSDGEGLQGNAGGPLILPTGHLPDLELSREMVQLIQGWGSGPQPEPSLGVISGLSGMRHQDDKGNILSDKSVVW